MSKKRNYLILFLILLLAFFAGNLDFPLPFDRLADYFNNFQFSVFNLQIRFPHFWQKPFRLGLDLLGGTHLLYQADLSKVQKEDKISSLEGLRDVIEKRVNLFGVEEPVVQIQGDKLIVELAGVTDPREAIKEIGKTPFLEFKELKPEEEVKKIEEKAKEIEGKTQEEIEKIKDWQTAFEDPFLPASLTGKYLQGADVGFDQTTYKPLVLLQFDEEGAKIFEEITSRNIGKPLGIFIDQIMISAPVVQVAIAGGKAQISGNFSVVEAKELARNLSAGALPVPINLISQQNVGPTLGKVALEKSLWAGIFGFLAVILFMLFWYRLPGIISGLSLLIYVSFILAIFKLIPVTLTLAGIAGFILSLGMAVDANVLIFERIREALKEGRDFSSVLDEGFRKAWPAIRDGNLTTLIATAILYGFGTSFIKGFAITLSIGILLSMFSALVLTKLLLKIFEGTKLEKIRWLW